MHAALYDYSVCVCVYVCVCHNSKYLTEITTQLILHRIGQK